MNRGRGRGRGNFRGHSGPPRDHSLDQKINKLIPIKLTSVQIRPSISNIKISNAIKPYELEPFMKLKSALNDKKSEMDKFYMDKKLADKFAQLTNALRITNQLRYEMQHEYNGQNVTRAWLKFYELFVHFQFVEREIGDVNAASADTSMVHPKLKIFFNAELPGAGICAINHLMKTYYSNVIYSWVASSIVLGKNADERITALGDQYGIWKNNKENWLMDVEYGEESADTGTAFKNNGDVTNIANILDAKKKIGKELPQIYTHDAGIEVSAAVEELGEQTGFNTQEFKNMKIHFGCAIAAFETLREGGCFLAKQYTFFEAFTINLILIYATMFEDFFICKPMTSGQSNSEIYLIGLGFKGYPKHYRDIFTERMENWNTNPFIDEKTVNSKQLEDAMSDILRYARMRNTEQIQYINENLHVFELIKDKKDGIESLRHYMRGVGKDFSRNWIKLYKPRRIVTEDYVNAD